MGETYLVTSPETARTSLKVAGIGLALSTGVILNETSPAVAKSISQEITEITNGLSLGQEIKWAAIGAGITCFKEFAESPREFIQSIFTLKHPYKTMEIIGNAVCGAIVGATIADAKMLLTSESTISLNPAEYKRLLIESALSIPATALILATTDRIRNRAKSTVGTIKETRANKYRKLEEKHALKDYHKTNFNRRERGRQKLEELGIDPRHRN
ncbi:MAG TPA: hypothetical protein VJ348_02735 [Candidatus Humimicrobiaceae bacterium]|nr:hypothetical protein [Candidatus Humimicrobiaceae bacterium]